jgi:hypothetical protein
VPRESPKFHGVDSAQSPLTVRGKGLEMLLGDEHLPILLWQENVGSSDRHIANPPSFALGEAAGSSAPGIELHFHLVHPFIFQGTAMNGPGLLTKRERPVGLLDQRNWMP